MAKFAVGKKAYGICDRSGFRYKLNDMRVEWNGLKVGRDMWEPKHPQLEPRRKVTDAQALKNPRPDSTEAPSLQLLPANPLSLFMVFQDAGFGFVFRYLNITVTHPGHGRSVADRVYFTNVQGFNTSPSSYFNREIGFEIDAILSPDSYRIIEGVSASQIVKTDLPTRGGGTLVTVRS